jgi:hypothetical protein
VLLEGGTVAAVGTHGDLMTQEPTYTALLSAAAESDERAAS